MRAHIYPLNRSFIYLNNPKKCTISNTAQPIRAHTRIQISVNRATMREDACALPFCAWLSEVLLRSVIYSVSPSTAPIHPSDSDVAFRVDAAIYYIIAATLHRNAHPRLNVYIAQRKRESEWSIFWNVCCLGKCTSHTHVLRISNANRGILDGYCLEQTKNPAKGQSHTNK